MELIVKKNSYNQPIAFVASFSPLEVSDKEVEQFDNDCWDRHDFCDKISANYEIATVCVGGVIAVDCLGSTPTEYIQTMIDDIEAFAKQKGLAIISRTAGDGVEWKK